MEPHDGELIATMRQNEKEINVLVEILGKSSETTAKEYILKQIEALHQTNETLNEQNQNLHKCNHTGFLPDEELHTLAEQLADFTRTLNSLSIARKREVVRKLVKKIVWDGENAQMYLMDPTETVF